MNRKSITRRLFFEIIFLILSFSVVLLLANSLLLKPLYYRSVKQSMKETMQELIKINYTDNATEWIEKIKEINTGNANDITVSKSGEVLYSSSIDLGIRGINDGQFKKNIVSQSEKDGRNDFKSNSHSPEVFFKYRIKEWKDLGENIYFGMTEQEVSLSNSNMFVTKGVLDEGIVVYITQNIEPVLESVTQANTLLIIVTFVFVIFSSLLAFKVSKNFTKPIREMQNHVNELAGMNFEGNLVIETGDELQELGVDINVLSDKLQEALEILQLQNQKLEQQVLSQKKFVSNASHELRTPLSLIKGYADEICRGFVSNREQEHVYVGYISDEAGKMARLIKEILDLSQIDSGRLELKYTDVDIKTVIQDFVDKYEGFIDEHQLEFGMALQSCACRIDLMRFEQILANYLSNCAKYSDVNKEVRIFTTETEECCRINVYNSGKAIPEEVADYIWDGFYKEDEGRATTIGSYGLGLSIVKAIQQLANQDYGTYNTNDGVVFWFEVKKIL